MPLRLALAAKNYSILLAGNQVRLAPLYDVSSALPYNEIPSRKRKLAMKIGGEYRLEAIEARHWLRFAESNNLDGSALLDRIETLAQRIPGAFTGASGSSDVAGLGSALPVRLCDAVAARAKQCLDVIRP